jgi:hypothetical protein
LQLFYNFIYKLGIIPPPSERAPEHGNALFLILIAVALFAALSYAITSSSRGSGSASSQQSIIYAAIITQAGADLKAGVQQMIFAGTPATSIVTGTPYTSPYPGNGSLNSYADFCTSGPTCLFAPDGGGATMPQLPAQAYVPNMAGTAWSGLIVSMFAGPTSYNGMSINGLSPGYGAASWAIPGIGTAAVDDVADAVGLTKEVCTAINKGLGLSGIPLWTAQPSGTEAACVDRTGTSVNFMYYQVLVAN